jgi:hypothetical protein
MIPCHHFKGKFQHEYQKGGDHEEREKQHEMREKQHEMRKSDHENRHENQQDSWTLDPVLVLGFVKQGWTRGTTGIRSGTTTRIDEKQSR